ncbi:hypothetical protein [Fluviispira vulneris]|uniref:hypothetical protein n=1 Tax=Fluviispira vulneris TaxID=2763012 RepID=UPI00164911A9|nr:hypothetical protein [Fluviispira vulneris]
MNEIKWVSEKLEIKKGDKITIKNKKTNEIFESIADFNENGELKRKESDKIFIEETDLEIIKPIL